MAELEARVAEESSGVRAPRLQETIADTASGGAPLREAADQGAPRPQGQGKEGELEYEVGQNWFARVGILVLAIGGVLLLLQPYAELPAAAPAVTGYIVALVLFGVARLEQKHFELVANYIRGAAMALLWFATVRLIYFGAEHALTHDSPMAAGVFAVVVALNVAIALRRSSPRLFTIALATGYGSAIAVGEAWFVLPAIVALMAVTLYATRRHPWFAPMIAAIGLGSITYLIWALGDPVRTAAVQVVETPAFAPAVLLACIGVFAWEGLKRWHSGSDPVLASTIAFANCAFGYIAFLVHTGAAFPRGFVLANIAASALFLGIGVLFWTKVRCAASTFFYAMAAYAALSAAIIKASSMPNVFVWLAIESIGVVATAIWFRSRFIVVANFLIFVAIVLGYMVLKERETGISIAIGIVALVSARVLNWQQKRLELKTELMRNAYLLSGFVIFPYAFYHLVPLRFVGLAWVGLAVVYYSLNLIVRSPKYRWMGHATLGLTTIYLVVAGGSTIEPTYRVVSFLALGTVLMGVSMIFSRLRRAAGAP